MDLCSQLVNLRITGSGRPTAEVRTAVQEVETSRQGSETAVNHANKYRGGQIPAAEAQADQILQQAEADKQSRINEATGQVARFNAMYEEYSKFPGISKQRMYYQAMDEPLPGRQVNLTEESGNSTRRVTLGIIGR